MSDLEALKGDIAAALRNARDPSSRHHVLRSGSNMEWAVQALSALHVVVGAGLNIPYDYCEECVVPWPCGTFRAMSSANARLVKP